MEINNETNETTTLSNFNFDDMFINFNKRK